MKLLISILICLFMGQKLTAQTPAEEIANRIAQRMKDTLLLTDSQRIQIYQINLQLSQQKDAMRSQHAGTDSLRFKIQQIENTRDNFYRTVLSDEKYLLYRQKKRALVNNN